VSFLASTVCLSSSSQPTSLTPNSLLLRWLANVPNRSKWASLGPREWLDSALLCSSHLTRSSKSTRSAHRFDLWAGHTRKRSDGSRLCQSLILQGIKSCNYASRNTSEPAHLFSLGSTRMWRARSVSHSCVASSFTYTGILVSVDGTVHLPGLAFDAIGRSSETPA
jgi:hypothetical protein